MRYEIAVIDDGVSMDVIPDLNFRLVFKKGFIVEDKKIVSHMSHGSICAAIIRKYAPQSEIGSIRVLHKYGIGNLDALLKALEWCVENEIKLIHMSIGSTQSSDYPALRKMVNKVVENGGIIIAACKNGCNVSYPASFSNVIGVRADWTLIGSQYIINKIPNGGIELSASACHDLNLLPDAEQYTVTKYNSFAAPVISAHIFNLLASKNYGDSLEEIRKELYSRINQTYVDDKSFLKIVHYFDDCIVLNNVPVVVFGGSKWEKILYVIAGKFLDDNYMPLRFSQSAESCSDECFYIEDITFLNQQCQGIADFYSADIILAVISEYRLNDIRADVFVYDHHLKINDEKTNCIIFSDGNDIDGLYNQLLTILESDDEE